MFRCDSNVETLLANFSKIFDVKDVLEGQPLKEFKQTFRIKF